MKAGFLRTTVIFGRYTCSSVPSYCGVSQKICTTATTERHDSSSFILHPRHHRPRYQTRSMPNTEHIKGPHQGLITSKFA
jgi:hypothetical protein